MPQTFVLGSNTIVKASMLPLGERVEPTSCTPAAGATNIAKGATSLTLAAALPSGVKIPKDTYLNFKDASGKEVLIQLSADAVAGNSSLPVYATPEIIVAASASEFPMRLRGRTNADVDRSGNRIESVDFDNYGYSDGVVASVTQSLNANGNWSPLDAGFATVEFAFAEKREIWYILELPRPSDAYIKGRIYKGPGTITSLPLTVPADGIIGGNISITLSGKPIVVNAVPTP